MLEQMRKSSQSLLIYVLFGIVIAVFIINFGPQSHGGCEGQMGANDHFAAKVSGDTISNNDYRYALLLAAGPRHSSPEAKRQRLKETVMDVLIERELLAQEAQRLGYVVRDEDVEDLIADSKMMHLGSPRPATERRLQKDGKFNYEAFKNFVQYELGITPKIFIEQQKKELLAARVRDLLRGSVTVSPEEVKADFLRRGRQVNLEFVRFAPERYKNELAPTEAEVAEYVTKNEEKLKKAYEDHKFVYENSPKKVHLRQILLKLPESAPEADKQAAQKKADALLARLKKGEPFAKVAKEASQDDDSRARGGDLGWRAKGTTGALAEPEEKLFAAKDGELVGPLEVAGGLAIFKVEGTREGTVPFEQAKLELAESRLRDEASRIRAKADADAALAKAKAAPASTTLKELFPAHDEDKNKDEKTDKAEKAAAVAEKASGKKGAAAPAAPQTPPPRAEETGLFSATWSRDGGLLVEGIGPSKELGKAAFALTPEAPVAGPFEVAGSWVVVRLKERKDPDLAELEKKKLDLLRDAELTKWIDVLTDWTRARCVETKNGKGIQVNPDVLRYEDGAEPPPYEPCTSRRFMGG